MTFRNLEVPYFSQRENKTVWHRRYTKEEVEANKESSSLIGTIVPNGKTDTKAKNSCNITSLAMILHYFGITTDTPDEMMRKVFSPTKDELKNYTSGQKDLVTETYKNAYLFESIEKNAEVCKRIL